MPSDKVICDSVGKCEMAKWCCHGNEHSRFSQCKLLENHGCKIVGTFVRCIPVTQQEGK